MNRFDIVSKREILKSNLIQLDIRHFDSNQDFRVNYRATITSY